LRGASGFDCGGGTIGACFTGGGGGDCEGPDGRALPGFVADVGELLPKGLEPNPAEAADKEKQKLARRIENTLILLF